MLGVARRAMGHHLASSPFVGIVPQGLRRDGEDPEREIEKDHPHRKSASSDSSRWPVSLRLPRSNSNSWNNSTSKEDPAAQKVTRHGWPRCRRS
jgi:hypothetical protein